MAEVLGAVRLAFRHAMLESARNPAFDYWIRQQRMTGVTVAEAASGRVYKRLAVLDPLSPEGRPERRLLGEHRRSAAFDAGGGRAPAGRGPPGRGCRSRRLRGDRARGDPAATQRAAGPTAGRSRGCGP